MIPPMGTAFAFRVDDPALRRAIDLIPAAVREAGGRALLVGGCVRDAALGLSPQDLDFEVYGLAPSRLMEVLRRHFTVDLVGQAFGVLKIQGAPVDLSIPRRESMGGPGIEGFETRSDPFMTLEEAAARRDFTINAMAYDPLLHRLLDPYGGLQDLDKRVLRHTSAKFAEDPLRVLRGMQFVSRFALTPAPETLALARQLLGAYPALAAERIWGEWKKWSAQSACPARGLAFLRDCGWIEAYPELARLIGCPQDPRWHPEGDVWTHTLLATDEAAGIALRDGLHPDDRATLVLAALCHDLGKPETTEVDGQRVRSPRHAVATETFRRFLGRITAPPAVVDRVVGLCLHHLTHLDFTGSARHVRRLAWSLAQAGESVEMLARVVEADCSGRPPHPKGLPEPMAQILGLARQLEAAHAAPRPLLLGRHLLMLGVAPGPRMGDLLRAAYEAQLDGDITNLDEARDWIVRKYPADLAPPPDSCSDVASPQD